ncbi:hypothetical protein JYA63_07355 [Fictibacillus nanhaiensis]|uniref:Uncharacterized protein n=1 Tax=Fictibacillus nanhaiensis TaxID=742169 RepID=A0ABS2ZPB2_9BACL|nr:hypothetical protein [Fictibacillus nanhaiensis]
MLNILIFIAFIATLGYSIYAKTTAALVIFFVIAGIGIVYRIYSGRNNKANINN